MELKPDPLKQSRPDDLPFVLSGCLSLFVLAMGGLTLWSVLNGGTIRGNVGRVMTFGDRLELAVTIIAVGLALLWLTRWGFKRKRSKH